MKVSSNPYGFFGHLPNYLTKKASSPPPTGSPKMKISIQDLEHISDALLCYTKHLARKEDLENMKAVKALDQKIFAVLEELTTTTTTV